MKRRLLIPLLAAVLLIVAAFGLYAVSAKSDQRSNANIAAGLMDLRRNTNPTNIVFFKRGDPELLPLSRLINPEDVVISSNSVAAAWSSKTISRDYLLVQSETDTNIWTLYRWNFIAYGLLVTLTNK